LPGEIRYRQHGESGDRLAVCGALVLIAGGAGDAMWSASEAGARRTAEWMRPVRHDAGVASTAGHETSTATT